MNDWTNISQVTDHIFLSGIYPLEKKSNLIRGLDIHYILSCVPKERTGHVHDKLLLENPSLTVLYIPYDDSTDQNLWERNDNKVDFSSYSNDFRDQTDVYLNKPLIEVAYHFIDSVVGSGQNVLVHCMAGMSRSVSMIAYYLMKKYKENIDWALQLIIAKRTIANPNPSFRKQLAAYQIKRDLFSESDAEAIVMDVRRKQVRSK